jgi:uncharacterized protein (TIGR02145 family)
VSLTDYPFGLAVTNAASGDSILATGVPTSLTIVVANNTNADILLASGGADASEFDLYLPSPALFTPAQLQAMTVTADGWAGAPPAADRSIAITRTQAGTWPSGQRLTFTVGNVTSSGPPGSGTVTLAPSNLGDNAPLSVEESLTVANPPKPGNLQLTDVLQVTLDSQGVVLRSTSADPLSNTLYLTLKNTGAVALAAGGQRFGNPQVLVSFIYGNTSGSLAPDTFDPAKGPQLGSAWNITSGLASAQMPWTVTDPRSDSQDNDPQWTVTPSPANFTLLGPAATDQANITVSFSNVISLTPAGHTQMLVLCTGFAKDAQTLYDDHLFVLDIAKVDAPPTRGLLSFFGPDPVIPVSDPDSQITIPLRWSMFDVASVQLLSSSPTVAAQRFPSQIPPKPVDYGNTTVTVSAPPTDEAIFFTLQAYDGNGSYLNSQQFTAYAQVSYLTDQNGHVYPIALFGNTFWMLANYQLNVPGSYDYGDNPANEATFGRLYGAQVLSQAPSGWQVPTLADWNALFGQFGDPKQAYAALIGGGRSGFNAQLGGQRSIQPNGSGTYQQMYVYGYYWATSGVCAQFSSVSAQASAGSPVTNPATGLSVRFIRHA